MILVRGYMPFRVFNGSTVFVFLLVLLFRLVSALYYYIFILSSGGWGKHKL